MVGQENMAKYGERISGRPSYQSHRQNYSLPSSAPQDVVVVADQQQLASRRDPIFPRSLQEEVLWRQRRFAWWGTSYLPDSQGTLPATAVPPHPSTIRSRLIQKILNRDVIGFLQTILNEE